MRKVSTEKHGARERRSERGAALITTLLIASLRLAAGGVLILTTGLSATPPVDATRSTPPSDPLYKPRRLLVQSTGYGPRGARKTLAMFIAAYALDIDAPAPLVMRGHDDHATAMDFDIGSSNAKKYSGHDLVLNGEGVKPSFAVSPHDINTALAAYTCSSCKPGTVIDPKMGVLDLPNEPLDPALASSYALLPTPWFLQTADNARLFLSMAQSLAQKKGKVLPSLN